MTEFLLRLFIKGNKDDPKYRTRVGSFAGIAGIALNALLLGKAAVALMAGSVAVLADAVNNLSDVSTSVVTLAGFKLAQRPADEEHPYGHGRYEYLAGLAVAALILLLGWELAKSAVAKIFSPDTTEISALTVGILAVSMLVKLWMSGFFKKLGKTIDSHTLMAASVDSRNDVLATGAVLLGCGAEYLFSVRIDGFVGLLAAVFILRSGIQIGKETVSPLLGRQAGTVMMEDIRKLILRHSPVLGIHDLLVHDYGPGQCYASVHVELNAEQSALVCHDIIDDIERDALRELNVHLVIHYDPVAVENAQWENIRKCVEETLASVNPSLSIHDFRLVHYGGHTRIAFDIAVPYGQSMHRKSTKQRIDDALKANGIDFETVIHFDRKV